MATAQDILQWLIWMSAFALPAVAIATGVHPVLHLKNLQFTQPAYNATIAENALGKTFVTPSTKMGMYLPLDDPLKVTYQIIGKYDDLFKAESYVLGDFCFLLVRTNSGSYGKLNREFQSLYQLKIQATAKDNNGSVHQTSADLSIFVSDLNDLSPIFDHKNYEAMVREDTPLHSSILKVSAYDGDEGINAQIYYSFVQKTNTFAIHPTTGIVTLTRPLNFVLQGTYSLEVMAEDRGPKQSQDTSKIRTTKLMIQVEQVNFFNPEIGINHLPSLEEREAGTVAAIVSVTDRDMGLNGKVDSLQIIGGNKEGLFSVVPGNQEGESLIVLNKTLSRKHSYGSFSLTLTVSDMGRPPRSSNATLFINVLDFYNNGPIFTKATYNISVEEIVPSGTPLLHLGPTSGIVKRIRHMLRITKGDEGGLFEISNNGLLSTISKLDADEVDFFDLEISAFDGQLDEKHKIGSTRVYIFVLDCNDNSPVFTNLETDSSVSIMENVPIGYQVFHVTASDKDKGENGLISYSITNSDSLPFEIDPFTGIIKTKQLLDYETSRHHYLVKVRASDWGTPFAQEVESFVTVNLLDQNDNTPKFEKINCTGFLSRDAPVNMELLVTSAIDLDASSLISYRILSGNADGCFTLDPTTAKLVLRCPLKNDPNDVKRVQIIATDGEHSSDPVMIEVTLLNIKHSTHLANSNVSIKCQDTNIAQQLQEQVTMSRKNNIEPPVTISNNGDHLKNLHPPRFLDNSPSSVDVSEKASVGSLVLTMIATDEDSGYSGLLVYVIKEGDPGGHFKIDTRTGQIVVAAELDREMTATYELVIEVSDLGSPALSANATLSVTIRDENDNAPVFERNKYEASISENIVVNATVTQVHASDMDIGKNAEIVYSIVSDTNFYIYSQSGIIIVNKVLDRELRQVYNVLVRASDKGEISLSSTATVAITLTDVNDNVPKFVTEIYSVRIREDLPIGTVVNTVTAEDLDLGSNGEVLYKLVYGDDYFEIDEETGTIRISQRLDYETRQVHNISVRAQDGGNPPLTSTCFINVEIVDVNENLYPPEFDSFFAQGYVNENEPVGTTVMFIHARDPDVSEEDGLITYSLRDGSGLGRFTIDQNGTIRTSQVLDRETATHYWLTVYAQDHGLVPLHSRLEVLIEIKDVNDNIPTPEQPIYYASVKEEHVIMGIVAEVKAYDLDKNLGQMLTFDITKWNDDRIFQINKETGVITTNGTFDREKKDVHSLEVTVCDNGEPNLCNRARVIIRVEDINDNKPQFSDQKYRVQILEAVWNGRDIPVFSVLASDADDGDNGTIRFSLRGNHSVFQIDKKTGILSATNDLVKGTVHNLMVRAVDLGEPNSRKSTVQIIVEVVGRPKRSHNAPKFISSSLSVDVSEGDKVGDMLDIVQAEDPDGDKLWYSIIDGDSLGQFAIGPEAGNLILAGRLDWEMTSLYNLTLQVTDGIYTDTCNVVVKVININDNWPLFRNSSYVASILESAPLGTSILQVEATDADMDNRLLYTFLDYANTKASLALFRIDPNTGEIFVKSALDREVLAEHNLTVMVQDQGTPSNRNYTRVTISILDDNDHPPEFLSSVFSGRVFETAAIGTSVVEVSAMDRDKGDNSQISYSIMSGNIGGVFAMESTLGVISVAKELDRSSKAEYELVVMATDKGQVPLSSTAIAKISITVSNNAPPKFMSSEYMAEVPENQPVGTNILAVSAECQSSVVYSIIHGGEENHFAINPNSGVVHSSVVIDYEKMQFYNLTISATNIIHATTYTTLLIHVIDENDNAPNFSQSLYVGNISETAKPGTVVLTANKTALVVHALDLDSGQNALLKYEIRDEHAKKFVTIDPNTGAIRTVGEFDHEVFQNLEFTVEVCDMGKPQLRGLNPAKVVINVNDVNDTPPKFSKSEYSAIVLIPTYQDVVITQVSASDPDSGINAILKYSIKSGNEDGKFCIKQDTGEVFVQSEINAIRDYHLVLEVTDGLFRSQSILNVSVQQSVDSGITFSKYIYKASAKENDLEVRTLEVIQVSGRALNQQYTFRLLNGQDKFLIGRTSGVLKTAGKPLDREQLSLYRLVVEVTGETGNKAHAIVEVIVEDENDNAPMFINQPYHAVALKDLHLGGTVKQVTAIDRDVGRNAYVSYKLTERGDIDNKFAIDSATGKILLSRALVESDVGREITLSIEASDGGQPRHTVQTTVVVKIINKYYPLFERQVYKAEIPENALAGTIVVDVEAISSTNQKLIYSVVHGDPYRDFWMDFNIGLITVKGQLDFEMTPSYNLTIEAMETLSGLSASAIVLIQVKDVNDNKPTFDSLKYVGIVSEAATIGTMVSKVTAKDRDTGINGEVQYSLFSETFGDKDTNYFTINSETGEITTNLFLDYDERSEFNFLVVAMDKGVPSLTSSVPVHFRVADLNDNAPIFDLPLYQCVISDLATRGQLVTKVSAHDLDTSSNGYFRYSIVSGNDKQTFHIDSENGLISLSENRKPQLYSVYDLNISVSDGVFTSYAKVGISVRNSNNYAPVFDQSIYVAEFPENFGVGMLVTSVSAIDRDAGTYGMLTYTIPSETLNAVFRVDADSGEIFSRQVLDREEQSFYEIPVAATDNGGRMSFAKIHVTITDFNDNAPMFLAQSYKSNIFPNTTINSTILQVTAIDQDSGVNGAVQYLLSNPPGSKAAKYFTINLHTGIITLIHSVEDLENEVFQFFVRAVDMGEPYFESNVNVEILVMFKDDRPPSFSQDNFSYFILESDPVGTVIATVKADSEDSVEYLIIPGQTKSSNTPPMFAVDGKGRIQVANYLNHETTSSFVLTVRAQTLTVPPLIRETRVTVNLMDVNDNCPVFESSSYLITVAEHAEIGTELIQVKAHDKDKAARLKYMFGHDIQEHSHMFGLDSTTGMLTLLSPLDRETKSQYNITIFVLDTDDAKSFKNSTVVYISVTDHNDNPPVFTRKKYQAAVNEDAYPGTIIMSVSTEDKDIGVNRDVMYFIMDGDELGRFQIQKNGEIFVNRELDRETTASYSLVVAATDGAFVSTATVVVDILDANDNSPVCGQAIHEKIVPEDAGSSVIIHWMKATDADEVGTRNSQIQYQLIGEGSDLFSLDSTSGILTSRGGLDREKQSFYKLIASAVDGGGNSCTTMIYISISDINDNAPEFDTPTAIVMVKEDVPVNSLVYRVSANDQDLGINGQILFYLKADGNGTFRVDPRSGLILLSKALDRETQSQYTLTIQATDQGTPHLTSEAILAVKVLDVNDNPPEFERTSYTSAIAEDAPVGKSVLTVRATSLDTGINAQITYSIVAGNDKKKFTIDPDFGVILTNDVLDHEEVSSFMLTIQAMDHGEEPLSNTVIVQINVTDVNDNPPVFSQSAYTAKVREDLKVGTKFLQLVATDADSTKNTFITFSIESGDHLSNFVIGKEDGALLVNTPLDREAISTYVLHVRATNDFFKTDTTVKIEVLDANDCPPRFSQDNYTVYVQEDRDIGVYILQFTVNDDDLDPNGPPFTFDIVKGNAGGEFRVDGEGILRTASKLNRRLTATYQLTVRVFDNGAPALYSDMDVTVFVIEESTFAPEVNNLEVSISSYLDDFPGGVIGQIKAVDADVHDTLTYEVVSPNRRLFDIDKKDGRILAFAGLDSGHYVVNISISDGKYTTYGKVDIDVSTVTEDMITNAITIQFDGISPDSFVRNYKKDFQRVLKRELSVRARDVEIISIQKSNIISEIGNRARRSAGNYLDVLFAVKRNPDSYMKQIVLRKKVQQAIDSIQDTLNVRIVKIFSDICEPGLCDGGGQCVGYVEFDKDSLVPIFMESGSFVSARHRYTYDCECPDGSIGETCLKNLTSCTQNPCSKYKICLPLSDVKFRCECPPGKTGKRCEKETDKCTTASCQKGDKPMTFSGQSYARWTLQESIENRLSLQLSIKTRKETANLMYVKGDKDYSILELVHGRIQYRFDCGSGEGLVIVPYIVSDGEWHTIIVERHGKQAEIFLDGKYSAITTAPGNNKNLDLNTKDVYFGAEVDVYQNGYRDIRKGFEGCMENIRIYNIRLPVSGSNAAALEQEFARIEFQCKDDEYPVHGNNVCSSFPCMNNGKCENTGLNSYICKCLDRYRGAKCEIDTDPCQESPCFNNGICTNIKGIPNEYHCTCTKEHMGRRCEYGQFCIPNPCIHGGSCIEGPSSYICMCRPGYGGTRCEQMVTTCRDNPCQNGGICQVTIEGLYYCNCTDEHRGHHCEDIRIPVITSNVAGINQSEIYVIVGVIGGMLLVVIIFVLVRYVRIRRREKQRRRNISAGATNTETEGFLKSDSNGFGSDKFIAKKPNRKNPPSPQPPPVPNRPASYTPSTHDSLNTLNNFDSVRNYGSAAEELENCHNIPYNLDFLQTFSAPPPRSVASIAPSLPPPPPSNSASDSDSVQKAPWILDCQNILQHYADKHADKLAKSMPVGTVVPMSRYQGHGHDTTSFSSLPISDTEDDLPANKRRKKKGYHWDTSDWAPQKSLPNISEVPPQACPDSPGSSSHQSNDSNTHVFPGNRRLASNIPEYIDSEYVGDSEYAENEYEMEEMPCPPNYEELLAQQHQLHDDYQLPHHNFNIHPNHYLPEYNIHDQSADSENWQPSYDQTADSEQSTEDDTDSVIHYGFPQRRSLENRLSVLTADSDFTAQNRLSAAYTTDSEWNGENYCTSMIESTDNMSVSAEGLTSANDSVSDISGLCEIEDSEINVSDDDVGDEPDETNALMAKLHT